MKKKWNTWTLAIYFQIVSPSLMKNKDESVLMKAYFLQTQKCRARIKQVNNVSMREEKTIYSTELCESIRDLFWDILFLISNTMLSISKYQFWMKYVIGKIKKSTLKSVFETDSNDFEMLNFWNQFLIKLREFIMKLIKKHIAMH